MSSYMVVGGTRLSEEGVAPITLPQVVANVTLASVTDSNSSMMANVRLLPSARSAHFIGLKSIELTLC